MKFETMSTNAFYCSRCGKFTRHCKISLREFCALDGSGFMGQAVALFDDVTGITHVIGTVFDCFGWKCMDCGRATTRNSKGEVQAIAKNS